MFILKIFEGERQVGEIEVAGEPAPGAVYRVEGPGAPAGARREVDPRAAVVAAFARRLRALAEGLDGNIPILRAAVPQETFEAEVLAGVEREARELAELTEGLAGFAQMELKAPRGAAEAVPVDLKAIVRKSARSTAEAARARRVFISERFPEGLPPVTGNIERLGAAIEDALGSIVRLSAEDAMVSIEGAAGEGSTEIVIASDRAPGIESVSLEELPARLAALPGPKGASVLLDLAIARAVAIEHGGGLRIEAGGGGRPRGGAIAISLPAAPVPVGAAS
jgi:signal transduction histidine kinase